MKRTLRTTDDYVTFMNSLLEILQAKFNMHMAAAVHDVLEGRDVRFGEPVKQEEEEKPKRRRRSKKEDVE